MPDRKQSFRRAPPLTPPSPERARQIISALVRWGPVRDFPWRRADATPFQILITEILLTRTRSNVVADVIREVWRRFPAPAALANSSPNEIAGIIAPLGLRKRAESLIACARAIEQLGDVPQDRRSLLQLPGVGTYVADATLVFAFGKPVIPIDAVIGRVLRRVLGYPGLGPAYADRALWQVAQRFPRPRDTRRVVAALLDLGALICLPQRPMHEVCPLADLCIYHIAHRDDDGGWH